MNIVNVRKSLVPDQLTATLKSVLIHVVDWKLPFYIILLNNNNKHQICFYLSTDSSNFTLKSLLSVSRSEKLAIAIYH